MEFDLSVPKPALINFSEDFIKTLPDEIREIIFLRDERLKFGSEYCNEVTLLKADLPATQINIFLHDLPVIYSFDVLINNKDRRIYKTNILVSTVSDDYFIFDHERAFKNIERLAKGVEGNTFKDTLSSHVLCRYLIHKRGTKPIYLIPFTII